jgi:tetratricopeptide (TPR) repeat protein
MFRESFLEIALVFLIAIFPSCLYAQIAPKTDSLHRSLQQARGEERVQLLWELSEQVRRSDIDSALGFVRRAVELSEVIEDERLLGESHRRLGRLLSLNGEHPLGLQYLLEAKQAFEWLQEPEKTAATLQNLGALYKSQHDYSTALEYYYQALELKEQAGDTDLSNTLINIGIINEELGQVEKGITFYKRALAASQQANNTSEIAITAVQISNAYASVEKTDEAVAMMNRALDASRHLPGEHATATILLELSKLYKNDDSFQEAMAANKEALSLAGRMSDGGLQALAMRNIAMIYSDQNNLPDANKYLLKAIPLFEKSGRQEDALWARNQVAHNFLIQGKPAQAIDMGMMSLKNAQKAGGFEGKRSTLEMLVEAYRQMNKLDKALETQEKMIAIKDSIFNETNSREIAQMQVRYDTRKKEQEIALLEKEKEQQALLRNAFLAGLILIGVIGVLVYNRQRLKIKKNRTELENKRLKEQQLEQDLEFRNKQLTTHTLHLVQKNEAMKELKEKIGTIRQQDNRDVNKRLQKLQNLVDYSFNLDEDWEEFQIYFEEVHSGFFDALKERYPDLTPNELRLSALAKLNLSIKETATIMGITPNSVKTARYRLRKKLEMETEENLTEFLMEIEKEEIG